MRPLCTRNVLAVFKIPVMPMASCLLSCQSQLKSHFVRLLRTRISKLHLDEVLATKTKHPSCWACSILHSMYIPYILTLTCISMSRENRQKCKFPANPRTKCCSRERNVARMFAPFHLVLEYFYEIMYGRRAGCIFFVFSKRGVECGSASRFVNSICARA